MRRKFFSLVTVLMLLIGILGSIPVSAADVSLSTSKKTIYTGSFFQLKLKNAKNAVVWKSNKETVAQVLPSGIVVGLKKGKATITATYDGIAYGCTVTVKDPSVNKTKATMRVDDTLRLKMKGANPVSWSSSNKKVATVDDGGLVKALMVGTTKITVKCEDGREYKSTITVKNYNLKVGDTIKMGHYEQDNNAYNGSELIEWEVLDVKDGKALLLTKDAIASWIFSWEPYGAGGNAKAAGVWEENKLRTWLNNDFYDEAFSKEEKEKICQEAVTADLNSQYNTRQGTATFDNIFILSIEQYLEYKPESPKSSKTLMGNGMPEYPAFWFRTAGKETGYLTVYANGGIDYEGLSVHGYNNCGYDFYERAIWSAMWITID